MVDDTQKSVDSIQQLLRRLKVIVYHYINASDMIERAKAYEKIADEVEAMEELTNNRNLSVEEFMKTWDAVKVKE